MSNVVTMAETPHITFDRVTRKMACAKCGSEDVLDEEDAQWHIETWAQVHFKCTGPESKNATGRAMYLAGFRRSFRI